MKNKKKLLSLILCVVMAFAITTTGCSAEKSDEERWNDSEYAIDADSVKEEADYSKFEEKDKAQSNEKEKKDVEEPAEEESAKQLQSKTQSTGSSKKSASSSNGVQDTKTQTCMISISCATILSNMGDLTEGKESLVPSDGVILGSISVEFEEGDTVFDVLTKVTRNNGIHMEYVDTPAYNSAYIEGISNLYEKDCGSGSGWMYCVNGWYHDYGCSKYEVEDGDVIEWNYTCDLGRDLGQSF